MVEKIFKFSLDIVRNLFSEQIEVVSEDISTNKFIVYLKENEIKSLDLTGFVCKIHFQKSDGTTVVQEAVIKEAAKGIIEFTLQSNTISVPGKVVAEVGIYETNTSENRLTSMQFHFNVRRSIVDSKIIESKDEIPLLNQKIQEAEDLKAEISGMDQIKGDEGKSAYQVWLEEGNSGTVSDFFNDIRGPQGIRGDDLLTGLRSEGKTSATSYEELYNELANDAYVKSQPQILEMIESLQNGLDGTTPHIGDNGNWFIGDTDTGVSAGGNADQEVEDARTDLNSVTHDNLTDRLNSDAQKVKNVEDKLNKKKALPVTLDPANKIKSVTNSYGGGCDFTIEGSLVERLVKNGDFRNGTTGWTSQGGSLSVANNIASAIGDGSATSINVTTFGEQVDVVSYLDDVFFVYFRGKVNKDGAVELKPTMFNGSNPQFIDMKGVTSPVKDKWYETYGTMKMTGDTTSLNKTAIYCSAVFVNTSTQNGAILDVDGDAGVCFKKIEGDDLNLTADQLKVKYVDGGYFEGLQPTRGVAVEAVGKNLASLENGNLTINGVDISIESGVVKFNGTGTTTTRVRLLDVIEGVTGSTPSDWLQGQGIKLKDKEYTINTETLSGTSTNHYFTTYYKNGSKAFETTASTPIQTLNTDDDIGTAIISFYNGSVFDDYSFRVQLEEGSTATTYEPHKSTKVVFEHALAKLPNGTMDKIVRENGKTVKYVETNVGSDGEFFKPETSTIGINTAPASYNHVYFPYSQFQGMIEQTDSLDKSTRVEGFVESQMVDKIGCYYTDSGNKLMVLVVGKTTCPDLATAQTLYGDKLKIAYQLATPYTVDLSDKTEVLNSYDDYTQFSVSDGVIEREKVIFANNGNHNYFNIINNQYYDDRPFKQKVDKILDVYCGERLITDLCVIETSIYFYGRQGFYIQGTVADINNIDLTDIYATYTTLETNNQANAKIKYNADLASVVSSNSDSLNVVSEQVDKLTDKVNEELIWIEPTLQNSWVNDGSGYNKNLSYAKDIHGWVHVTGQIRDGNISVSIFKLPVGFRPLNTVYFNTNSNYTYGGGYVLTDGNVVYNSGINTFVSMDFKFYAGN